ncbi:MAG: DotD/TraH family lipoprotein [Gammaproteobacteria bacterium]|nr:DotD/TraH family lipoprotein [Gammaproteobacteria bacterium]
MSRLVLFLSLISITSIILLSGCTLDENGDLTWSDEQVAVTDINNINVISNAALSVTRATTELEKIERYRKPRIVSLQDESNAKYHLGQRVNIDWSGPIEPLISEVAAFSDYKLKIVGVAPAIPVLIDIAHNGVELGDVVREIHFQSKDRANLVVYPRSRTIELRYNEIG